MSRLGRLAVPPLFLAGALLDVVAIPPGPAPILILVADVPFLWLIGGGVSRRWRLLAWLYGLLHFAVALRWLGQVQPVFVAVVAVVLSFVPLFAAAAIRFLVRRRLPYLLVVPTVLVFEEMLRTVWFGGMPWPARSLSFAAWPGALRADLVAASAWFGAYALSFLAALAGAAVARLAPRLALAFAPESVPARPALGLVWPALVGVGLVASGAVRIATLASEPPEGAEIVAVQASIPQSLKHSDAAEAAMHVFRDHLDLTRQAIADARDAGRTVDAVIWPETMVPWPFVSTELAHRFPDEWENELRIVQNVARAAEEGDPSTRYLLGAIYQFRRDDELHESVYDYGTHDSLFLVDPSRVPPSGEAPPPPPPLGETPAFLLGRHDKRLLVPGGEYTPLGDVLPPLRAFRDLVSVIPPLDPGREDQAPLPLTARADGARFGTVLCFELLFPARCRAWRRRGADVLVNAANYGWFGPTGFRAQIRAAAALRAAETGVRVVVAGNTGPTAFFDPLGRRHGVFVGRDGTVTEPAGSDPTTFRPGYARGRLRGPARNTLYTRLGDLPWWLLGAALVLVWAIRRGASPRSDRGAGGAAPPARPRSGENL